MNHFVDQIFLYSDHLGVLRPSGTKIQIEIYTYLIHNKYKVLHIVVIATD